MVMQKPDFSKVTPSGRTPLVEFKGRLVAHEAKVVTFGGGQPRTDVVFHFAEMDVVKSDVPYLLPIADVSIAYKESENSTWGILGKSFAEVLGLPDYKAVDIEATYGKMQHWQREDNHKFGERKTVNEAGEQVIEEMKGSIWHVLSVEGVSKGGKKVSAIASALKLLDGKNEGDFYRAALQDQSVKADATLTDQIMNETFIPAMTAIDTVMKDDNGVFHVDWDKAPK